MQGGFFQVSKPLPVDFRSNQYHRRDSSSIYRASSQRAVFQLGRLASGQGSLGCFALWPQVGSVWGRDSFGQLVRRRRGGGQTRQLEPFRTRRVIPGTSARMGYVCFLAALRNRQTRDASSFRGRPLLKTSLTARNAEKGVKAARDPDCPVAAPQAAFGRSRGSGPRGWRDRFRFRSGPRP